eukprot:TRINITY_DN12753_c0_g2_i1.p1 TRINITY_DN12753_c0_g2~~TRINITY_DN12753_c0_g2_i1.p1  ORF type:complete len:347 (-),score=90.57 TRINITY_DN12753_c0_g2_i1:79-1119(-)
MQPPAGRKQHQVDRLNAPLLECSSGSEAATGGGSDAASSYSGIRRLIAWRGPEPAPVAGAMLLLGGSMWWLEARKRMVQASPSTSGLPPGIDADGEMVREVASAAVDAEGSLRFIADSALAGSLGDRFQFVAIVLVVCIVVLAVVQYYGEMILLRCLKQAAGQPDLERVGSRITVGSARIWLLTGQIVVRNAVVTNPAGFDSAHALMVRCATADVGFFGLLLAVLTSRLPVREVRLEGMDAIVELNVSSSRTNAEAMLQYIEESAMMSPERIATPRRPLSVKIRNLVAAPVASRSLPRGEKAGIYGRTGRRHLEDFSKELAPSEQPGDVLAAMTKLLLQDVLACLN